MWIHSIFKNLSPVFSYFTYKLFKIFITCSRKRFIASKVWKKIVLIFLYTLYKARRKSESSFSHSFLAIFPSLVMQQISSFFKQVCFEKNAYGLLVFFNWVPYMQLSHMIPGVNIIGRKVSVASVNGAGESGCVLRLQWGP